MFIKGNVSRRIPEKEAGNVLTRNNLKKLANASIGNEKDWESEDAAKAFKKGLNLVARDMKLEK